MDAEDFAAAGLYDPASPNAADRLELLRWLVDRGVTLDQMTNRDRGSLTGLAGDLALRPGRRTSARAIASRVDMNVDDVLALSLAAGLSPRTADDPVFTEDDCALFEAFRGGAAMFGRTATLSFTRVVGSSLARVAEAAVSLFQVEVEQRLLDSGGSELALAKQNLLAIESLQGVRRLLNGLFGSQVETAIRRLREAREGRSPQAVKFAVGFIDLVGFTTLSRSLNTRELANVVEQFEDTAYEVVAAHDGRLVKLIGDEIMFVTRDAAAGCNVALAFFERFAGHGTVTPRGAVAYGEMLLRGGDYYGPVVNLASRVAEIAVPSELLVTPEVAAQAVHGGIAFEPAGKRMLKGFDEPIALFAASRAAA
jgi:adenylate cyclase